MLFVEYECQNLIDCNLGSAFVQHLCISFFAGEVVNLCVDCPYDLLVKLALACKDCLAACGEQNVIVQCWNEQLTPLVEELLAQIYSRAAAIADDVGVIAVEHHHACYACNRFYLYKVTYYVVERVVAEAQE